MIAVCTPVSACIVSGVRMDRLDPKWPRFAESAFVEETGACAAFYAELRSGSHRTCNPA